MSAAARLFPGARSPPASPTPHRNRFEPLSSTEPGQPAGDGQQMMMNVLLTISNEMSSLRAEQQHTNAQVAECRAEQQHTNAQLAECLQEQRVVQQQQATMSANVRELQQQQARTSAEVHEVQQHTLHLQQHTLRQQQQAAQEAQRHAAWEAETARDAVALTHASARLLVRAAQAPPEHATREAVAQRLGVAPSAVQPLPRQNAFVVDMGSSRAAAAALRTHRQGGADMGGLGLQADKTLLGQRRAACMNVLEREVGAQLARVAQGWQIWRGRNGAQLLLTSGSIQQAMRGEVPSIPYPVWRHVPYNPAANGGMGGFVLEPKRVGALEHVPNILRELLGTAAAPAAPRALAVAPAAAASAGQSQDMEVDRAQVGAKRGERERSFAAVASTPAASPPPKRQPAAENEPPAHMPPPPPTQPVPPHPSPPRPQLQTPHTSTTSTPRTGSQPASRSSTPRSSHSGEPAPSHARSAAAAPPAARARSARTSHGQAGLSSAQAAPRGSTHAASGAATPHSGVAPVDRGGSRSTDRRGSSVGNKE